MGSTCKCLHCPFFASMKIVLIATQAKGGFKTRRKRNINKWVVEPRMRNVEKRRMAKMAKKK
jgi:hypothetical protein